MEMVIDFPGGAQVDAHFGSFTVETDQPALGYQPKAPTPFAIFLASMGTCAGIFVLGFCKQRGISPEGIRIVQSVESNHETHMITKVNLDIQLPADFPEKYKTAVIRAANQCAVKRHLENPPKFDVFTSTLPEAPSA
ncbi:MAG: osmotically inducible protein OsmC [Chloroflexi bacterium]|nr:MAG: osmotically inducible protein OsmC [Chloroflexota bacterium]